MSSYKATIGIECHVQLKTATKLFAAVSNDARAAEPNTLISHICMGMPGSLPVLNGKVIELATKAAFALGTRPQAFSKFDRKHYFYPDLPKGYQISQFEQPIILGGHINTSVEGKPKRINLTRAHLEEDAGKSTHPEGANYSLVDLNRAGTPLIEIVSEPEMHSAAEAKAYAQELYLLMKYADVSDVDLYHGNMRFDVNVSVSKTEKLGTRTETKNLNSFRSVEKAIDYEIVRQSDLLDKGKEILQETRGWDDTKQKTYSQRSKEDSHDYRYFPDPDLPPIVIDEKFISVIENSMPQLPDELRRQFEKIGLDSSQAETLLYEPEISKFVVEISDSHGNKTAKTIANWVTGEIQHLVVDGKLDWQQVLTNSKSLVKLVSLVDGNLLSSTAAKEVLVDVLTTGSDPQAIAESKNLIQESDESALIMIIEQVISDNQKAAEDVRNGEIKVIGFLVGQVMKASQGKANPTIVQNLIKKLLGV
ncbi:Asp-tRNA(Asn)/Glu-tRNA(Gln) amidotransferase subunit GatB [Candidatus Saccharibacteria bacterium]|nr:Asp-tRNA(Asn)/Glu-tRNA(Gln) amidotransferase subunit GatB [Candidatus Saccharibacteria bacterium]